MTLAPRSLQGRVLTLVLGLLALIWLGTAVWTWRDVSHELDELLDSHLAQAAALLVAQQVRAIGHAGEDDDDDDDRREIDAPVLHRYAPKVAFQVFHEGHLVLRSAGAPDAPLDSSQPLTHGGFVTVQRDGASWRVFSALGAEHDVRVLVGEHHASRREILRAVLRSTLAPLALALPLLALGAWWAVASGLRPLARLRDALASRRPDQIVPVELADAPSEMQPMIDALNALLQRIGVLLEGERRFTADAAHELRTPIAAVRAQAQVALAATDDASRRHALLGTLAGCDRAAHLVAQMLTLARLDAGAAATRERLDLSALAREQAAALAPKALERGQELVLEADRPLPVLGDAGLLGVLVRNLLDNAMRYSPPGARIRLATGAAAASHQLVVEDSGPGLEPDMLARLGERFFRAPGGDAHGSGLGWSIAARVAHAQGATLRADRSPSLGGLRVALDGLAKASQSPAAGRAD